MRFGLKSNSTQPRTCFRLWTRLCPLRCFICSLHVDSGALAPQFARYPLYLTLPFFFWGVSLNLHLPLGGDSFIAQMLPHFAAAPRLPSCHPPFHALPLFCDCDSQNRKLIFFDPLFSHFKTPLGTKRATSVTLKHPPPPPPNSFHPLSRNPRTFPLICSRCHGHPQPIQQRHPLPPCVFPPTNPHKTPPAPWGCRQRSP